MDADAGQEPGEGAAAAEAELGGVDWRLAEVRDRSGGVLVVDADVIATATFADGRMAGSTGCNRYFGTCTLDGGTMRVSGVATTLRACPPPATTVETAFLAALEQVAGWELSAGRLDLAAADGTVVLRFMPRPATPLVGTTWSATAINNGHGGVASLLEGSTGTATFDADGTVSGTTGCDRFAGPYVLEPPSLTCGPLATTGMACPQPLMEQERAFLAALGRVATVSVEGDELELRSADGALQAAFRAVSAD